MELLTTTAEMLLAIGDESGLTPRAYATQKSGSPDMNRLRRIDDLIESGLVSAEETQYRGRPVRKLTLTVKGNLVYTLLRGVREILKEGSP